MIDVELDEPRRRDLAALLHRPAAGPRDPARGRGGRRRRLASLPDDDPRAQAHDIYHWVGYLQETLVDALSADASAPAGACGPAGRALTTLAAC